MQGCAFMAACCQNLCSGQISLRIVFQSSCTYFGHLAIDQDQTVVLKVRDDNVALRVEGDTSGSSQSLQVTAVVDAVEREARNEVSIGTEQLDTVVARVSNQDLRLGVDCASPGVHELTQFFSVRAELQDVDSSAREYLSMMKDKFLFFVKLDL